MSVFKVNGIRGFLHEVSFLCKNTVVCLLSFLCLSCATYGSFDRADAGGYASDFRGARAVLEDEKDELYTSADAVLYFLDTGLLEHYAGNFTASNASLSQAEVIIYQNFAKSVTQTIGSYVVNDTLVDYAGEDYEDIYTNIFMALNYCRLGDMENAFVEIRRFDNKLKAISTKYADAIASARNDAESEGVSDYGNSVISFYNSALARYVSMLLYRSAGDYDSAKVDMKYLYDAFANQKQLYNFTVPASVREELTVPAGMARMNVISFSGLAPEKIEDVLRVPISNSRYYKLALPVMKNRYSAVRSIRVSADTGDAFSLEKLEDISAIAHDTFKQRQALIYFRSIMRSVVKAASSAVLNEVSDETENSTASFVLGILSLGAQIYSEVSEQADLRISRYFPDSAWVGGITLEPGVYSFTVEYLDGRNNVVAVESFDNVAVNTNSLNLVESVCLN